MGGIGQIWPLNPLHTSFNSLQSPYVPDGMGGDDKLLKVK
jgi:hypothetical protein